MLVPMKKVTLFAMKDDRDAILRYLQQYGDVMLLQGADEKALPGAAEAATEVQRANEAIKFLEAHSREKPRMVSPRLRITYNGFENDSTEARELTDQVEGLASKINSLRNEAETMRVQIEKLQPWLKLTIPLETLVPTEYTEIFAGYVPEELYDKVVDELGKFICEVTPLESAPEGKAILIVAYKTDAAEIKHMLKANDFIEFVFPKRSGTAGEIANSLAKAATEKDNLADQLEAEAVRISGRKKDLKLYYDQSAARKERLETGGKETERTFCLTGWCRADRSAAVEEAVGKATAAYEISFADPGEGEVAPTVVDNGFLIRPYEAVTDMYSRPAQGAFDPNCLVAPFFCCFFGMMLSDAGYGILLTIIMLIFIKLVKPVEFIGKLSSVLLMGGLSTIFWGALFGGWFGVSLPPLLFNPMEEPMKMLVLCYVLGAMHLILGMLVKIAVEAKRGHFIDAMLDVGMWIIMFAGFAVWGILGSDIGKYMAMTAAAIIVLTGGRAKKGVVSKLIGGLLTLYGISSYMADLLSYSRLFALGLATGVVAMIINTVAKLLWDGGSVGIIIAIALLVGGHFGNLVINVLGSFVHSSRLQYIEFFNKFYEAGGRAFVPLSLKTRYTEITK